MITSHGLKKLGFTPQLDFTLQDDGDGVVYIKEWLSSTAQPSDADIDTATTEAQGIYDSQEYARTRKAKYDLLNQDEMRYDDLVNNTTTWRDGIAAIKVAHPKP